MRLELATCAVLACSSSPVQPALLAAPPTSPVVGAASSQQASLPARATSPAHVAPPEASVSPPCPAGMQHIQKAYCPELRRQCIRSEYDEPNRITICHEFREQPGTCEEPRVALDYCIDEFEFPNQRGEKPPVMVDFYDAEKGCAGVGKRLCTESEWVAACEGPAETPFPHGYRRSPEKCNIDNPWVAPILSRVYARDDAVRSAELARLDRSVPSGSKPECRSGFGVFDLTGNVDEWVRADASRDDRRARFAALKGGAWGHVRNACRPVTTSHAPDFEYYFIGFRCCADAVSSP